MKSDPPPEGRHVNFRDRVCHPPPSSPLILLSSHPPLCRMETPLSTMPAGMAKTPLPLFSWRGELESMTRIMSPIPPPLLILLSVEWLHPSPFGLLEWKRFHCLSSPGEGSGPFAEKPGRCSSPRSHYFSRRGRLLWTGQGRWSTEDVLRSWRAISRDR
jgi:hypothetical protein